MLKAVILVGGPQKGNLQEIPIFWISLNVYLVNNL